MKDKTVCIVGLGYVGLPLADAFSKHLKVIGYDVDEEKTRNLGNNNNNEKNIEFTTDQSKIKHADFVIIAVPTPVTKSKEPDLRYVKLFCKQKPLLKNAYASFLQAKTFTKLLRKVLSKRFRRKTSFFGQAFFLKERLLVKFLKLFKRKVCDKRIGTAQRKLQISPCMGVVEDCSVRSRNAVARLNFFSIFIDSRNSNEKKGLMRVIRFWRSLTENEKNHR